MGDVLNSETEGMIAPTSAFQSLQDAGSTSAPNVAKPTVLPFDLHRSPFPDGQKKSSRAEPRRTSHELNCMPPSHGLNISLH